MKYIVIPYKGLEVPIVFPDVIQHDLFTFLHPISAGFTFRNGVAVGKSISLGLKSREEDTALLQRIGGINK
jgi:hypothetical protein